MKVTRYVSEGTLAHLRKGYAVPTGVLNQMKQNTHPHPITIELPDEPIVVGGYWCDDKGIAVWPCNTQSGCSAGGIAFYNCRKVRGTLEVVE
jgi:hypothetical protein